MFERLKRKWKVESNLQLVLILCTFAVTGTLTAWISRGITAWVGFDASTFWLWKFLLRAAIPFFWAYERKILRWMAGKRRIMPVSKEAGNGI
jgi:hypothetical protein